MTHTGKIGRLPKDIRDQLNRRLQDGEPGKSLVDWLNALPEVRTVLAEHFGGRGISEQNLSEWKSGGYEEWLRHEEARDRVRWLTERAEDLDDAADGLEISDRLGSILAVELVDAIDKLSEISDPKERWHRLQQLSRELWRLRSEDHNGKRLQLDEERWERAVERQDEEHQRRLEKERRERLVNLFFAKHGQPTLAQALGGNGYGEKWADWLVRVQHGLSMPDWCRTDNRGPDSPEETESNQSESNQIKPDQSDGRA